MKNKTKGSYKAILAYITFVGLIFAFILNVDKKDPFVSYHIKNMFGLVLISAIPISFVNDENLFIIGKIVFTILVILWSYSLLMAILSKRKGIPVLSDLFQKWFKFLD